MDVTVPLGTPEGTEVTIAVTATSTSIASNTNSATQTLTVEWRRESPAGLQRDADQQHQPVATQSQDGFH